MLTIFTPTFNRAYTLPRLYKSLLKQGNQNFEWLVIDDGSTDETGALFKTWLKESNGFEIRYYYCQNGGKQRAINQAVQIAHGEFFFIVDSDDYLTADAVSFVYEAMGSLPSNSLFAGISGVRGDLDGKPLFGAPHFDGKAYIDANNLERGKYGLQHDMAEVFLTSELKKYPFPVWENEKFTPEAVVWDKLALDGYKIRWYDKVIYYCEYQADGLTNSSWSLLKNNPMGYAMLFNIKLASSSDIKERMKWTIQKVSCCCLAHEYRYLFASNAPVLSVLLLPLGLFLSLRRRYQFKKYISS